MNIIEVKNLIRNYQKSIFSESDVVKVLKGLSFGVQEGDFVGVMGKSGCGKTTLLKLLGLIDRPTEGDIYFKGKNIGGFSGDELADFRRTKLGFIFQDFYLMDSLSVEENIMLPMILGEEKLNIMTKILHEYAKHFQISHLLKKNPYELSGGEKQRVAICRALVNNPELILADEPTGNLDSKSGDIVVNTLERINCELGKTVIMVTHDPQVASYCKRIIFLKDGVILDEIDKNENKEKFYQEIIRRMVDL